jgi:hypothetical protein
VVLSAVEDTLKDQKHGSTPTAYFAALLALFQSISSSKGIINKELATSVVYLLDLVTPYVPQPLLRSKFSQILPISPLLSHQEAEAPLLRSSIGCLESRWSRKMQQHGLYHKRRLGHGGRSQAVNLGCGPSAKGTKRAQEGLIRVLKSPPRALLGSPCSRYVRRDCIAKPERHSKSNGDEQETSRSWEGRSTSARSHTCPATGQDYCGCFRRLAKQKD